MDSDGSGPHDKPLVAAPPKVSRALRSLAWAAGLGAVSGVVTVGIGSRIVMRVIALADSSTDGTFTDAEATVGEFSIEGSLSLFPLGIGAGILGGLLFLGVRRWLPVPTKWKGAAYGLLTLLTVGNLLFDPSNADFQIFEPVLLVVALFTALFFVNGLLLGWLMQRFHPEPAYEPRPRAARIAVGLLGAVCLLGGFAYVGGILGMVEDQGTCLRAAGGGNGCALPANP